MQSNKKIALGTSQGDKYKVSRSAPKVYSKISLNAPKPKQQNPAQIKPSQQANAKQQILNAVKPVINRKQTTIGPQSASVKPKKQQVQLQQKAQAPKQQQKTAQVKPQQANIKQQLFSVAQKVVNTGPKQTQNNQKNDSQSVTQLKQEQVNQQSQINKINTLVRSINDKLNVFQEALKSDNADQEMKKILEQCINEYDKKNKEYIEQTVQRLIKDNAICKQVKLIQRMITEKSVSINEIKRQQQVLKEQILNSTLNNSIDIQNIKKEINGRQNKKNSALDDIAGIELKIQENKQRIDDGVDIVLQNELEQCNMRLQKQKNELMQSSIVNRSVSSGIMKPRRQSIRFDQSYVQRTMDDSYDDSGPEDILKQLEHRSSNGHDGIRISLKDDLDDLMRSKSKSIDKRQGILLQDDLDQVSESKQLDEQSHPANVKQISEQTFRTAMKDIVRRPVLIIDNDQKVKTLQTLIDHDYQFDVYINYQMYVKHKEKIFIDQFGTHQNNEPNCLKSNVQHVYLFTEQDFKGLTCNDDLPENHVTIITNKPTNETLIPSNVLLTRDLNVVYSKSQYAQHFLKYLGYTLVINQTNEQRVLNDINQYVQQREQTLEQMKEYVNQNLTINILQNNFCDIKNNFQRSKRSIRNIRKHYSRVPIVLLIDPVFQKDAQQMLNDPLVSFVYIDKPDKKSYLEQLQRHCKKSNNSKQTLFFLDNNHLIIDDTLLQVLLYNHLESNKAQFIPLKNQYGNHSLSNTDRSLYVSLNKQKKQQSNLCSMKSLLINKQQLEDLLSNSDDISKGPYDTLQLQIDNQFEFQLDNDSCKHVINLLEESFEDPEGQTEFKKKNMINNVFLNEKLVPYFAI